MKLSLYTANQNFLIPITLQLYDVNLFYFKVRLLNMTKFLILNIQGVQHWVSKIYGCENKNCGKDSISSKKLKREK